MRSIKTLLLAAGLLLIITACSTLTATQIDSKRNELNSMADEAIARIVEKNPAVQTELDQGLAWGVANMKLTKVPVVGGGGGEGVLIIKETGEHFYFKVRRFDLGGGWGARAYKALMIFTDQAVLDDWKTGEWVFAAGAEAAAGEAAAAGGTGDSPDQGFTMHVLAEGGASATATARVIRIKIDRELTDVD